RGPAAKVGGETLHDVDPRRPRGQSAEPEDPERARMRLQRLLPPQALDPEPPHGLRTGLAIDEAEQVLAATGANRLDDHAGMLPAADHDQPRPKRASAAHRRPAARTTAMIRSW